MITLCSLMRNSTEYVDRYFQQVKELMDVCPDLRVIVGHGDHTDSTAERLYGYRDVADLVNVTHGGVHYGSVDHPARWDQIAGCVRKVIQAVGDDPGSHLIWVESDLVWTADDLLQLMADSQAWRSTCPMVMANWTERFYDIWGYRINGAPFLAQPPYLPTETFKDGNMVKIQSCGSCFVTPRNQFSNIQAWSGHWPYKPMDLWMDTEVRINHP